MENVNEILISQENLDITAENQQLLVAAHNGFKSMFANLLNGKSKKEIEFLLAQFYANMAALHKKSFFHGVDMGLDIFQTIEIDDLEKISDTLFDLYDNDSKQELGEYCATMLAILQNQYVPIKGIYLPIKNTENNAEEAYLGLAFKESKLPYFFMKGMPKQYVNMEEWLKNAKLISIEEFFLVEKNKQSIFIYETIINKTPHLIFDVDGLIYVAMIMDCNKLISQANKSKSGKLKVDGITSCFVNMINDISTQVEFNAQYELSTVLIDVLTDLMDNDEVALLDLDIDDDEENDEDINKKTKSDKKRILH